MRRHTLLICAATLALSAVAGCGSGGTVGDPPSGTVDGPAVAEELVAQGIVMQASEAAPVELCIGPIAESYPPQCRGPELLGEFSWDDVQARQQGGVRWSDEGYFAVGRYDRTADTFTLSRPLSTSPPEGFVMPAAEPVEFPQLCEDPFRGGDASDAGDLAAPERLQQRLTTIDGYVTSWVSDGVSLFNVVVTGDAEAARAALREVWPGGLCVVQRDLPTADELAAAQAALTEHAAELGLTTAAANGVSGVLEVGVVVADAATTALVHDVVSPWMGAEQVRVVGAMVPLAQG